MAAMKAPEGRRKSACIQSQDLEDLHPHLMYGAIVSFLRALANSLCVIAPAVLSFRFVICTLAAALLIICFVPILAAVAFLLLAEVAFYIWQCGVFKHLNRRYSVDKRLPPPTSAEDVFRRTMANVDRCAAWKEGPGHVGRSAAAWLEGWLLCTPIAEIKQENAMEFLAWAFYCKDTKELDAAEQKSVASMLAECENRYGWGLLPGYNPAARTIRINFDPIVAWCHPMWYYAFIKGLSMSTAQTLRLLGFKRFEGAGVPFWHCPDPRHCLPGRLTAAGEVLEPRPELPIVFIHGLGVGLAPYLRFIRRIAAVRECFIVELPEISQCCSDQVLPPAEMANHLASMLQSHGHAKATFVAHSYGTFVLSWVVRMRRDIVSKVVLMDPACLMLSQPDVAYNFLYRRPNNPMTLVAAHFVRWELYSANVLMRHFYWYHNVMWRDEIPEGSAVVIGSNDDIIDPHVVRRYVEEPREGTAVKLLWLEGFFHGGILLSRAAQLQVMELL